MESLTKEQNFVVEKEGQKFIDVIGILPETLPSGKKIVWKEVDDGKVFISVDKHSARGGNAKPITVNRFIKINEDLFEFFGFWIGDSIRKQATENTLGFSNTEIFLHKEFLRGCNNIFGLDKSLFKCSIQITSKFKNLESKIKSKISEELEIPSENFWKTRINDKRNTIGIDIRTDSRLWGIILNFLFGIVNQFVFQNKKFIAKMLQAIIASESNVHIRNDSGRLGEISIAAKDSDKRDFVRSLLLSLGIQPSKDKTIEGQEAVLIHGLSNFKIVKEWNLISLHSKKLKDFEMGLVGFKKEEFRKGECKFLVLQLLSNSKKSVKEMAKLLNRKPRTINDAVAFLEKKNLIERIRSGRNIFWDITENGLLFLKNNGTLKDLRKNS